MLKDIVLSACVVELKNCKKEYAVKKDDNFYIQGKKIHGVKCLYIDNINNYYYMHKNDKHKKILDDIFINSKFE